MQSLGQAVYRYLCKKSRDGLGVKREELVKEMASRGYREPLSERIDEILREDLKPISGEVTGPHIVIIGTEYFQKRAYLRYHRNN